MALVVTITIPDAAVVDAQAALSALVNLPATGPNAKLGLMDFIKRVTTNYRVQQAANAATVTATASATTDLSGMT